MLFVSCPRPHTRCLTRSPQGVILTVLRTHSYYNPLLRFRGQIAVSDANAKFPISQAGLNHAIPVATTCMSQLRCI